MNFSHIIYIYFCLICQIIEFSSPTYQLASKGRKLNKKEAPLVDPEPTSDISNFNTSAAYPPNSNGNVSKSEASGADATKAPLKSIQGIHSSTHGESNHPSFMVVITHLTYRFRFGIEQSASVRRTMRSTCIGSDDLKFQSTNFAHKFGANLRYTNTKSTHRKWTENRAVHFGRRRCAQRREKCAQQHVSRVERIQCMSWIRIADKWRTRAKRQFLGSKVLGGWAAGSTWRSSFGRSMSIRDSKWVNCY